MLILSSTLIFYFFFHLLFTEDLEMMTNVDNQLRDSLTGFCEGYELKPFPDKHLIARGKHLLERCKM